MTPTADGTASSLLDILFLVNWNTRIVVLGVTMLGAVGGVVGTFMLLRKRALIGDAVSHATLPGIVIAFFIATALGAEGRTMWILLTGALVAGLLGIFVIQFCSRIAGISHDAALGIVLSCFFGTGVALLGIAQQTTMASVAGLDSFIYGKTASMLAQDALMIAVVAGASALVCLLFFKELRLVCFDADYARGRGIPTVFLDLLLMGLVLAVVIVGLQAVGAVLVIAILVIPAAAARFWTDSTGRMVLIAAGIGALGSWLGTAISATAPRLPSGALVVLALGALFAVSLLLGRRRGLLQQAIMMARRNRRIRREHALRATMECMEMASEDSCSLQAVADRRGWERHQARRAMTSLVREGTVTETRGSGESMFRLTPGGTRAAREVVRRHRLWEYYLIKHANFDSGHVDRGADELEHLLPPSILEQLETELSEETAPTPLPDSPHQITSLDQPEIGGAKE